MFDAHNDNSAGSARERLSAGMCAAMVGAYRDGLDHFAIGEVVDEIRCELDVRLYVYPDWRSDPRDGWVSAFMMEGRHD